MKVELTEDQWKIIMTVLGEVAWKVANPLIVAIAQQIEAAKSAE